MKLHHRREGMVARAHIRRSLNLGRLGGGIVNGSIIFKLENHLISYAFVSVTSPASVISNVPRRRLESLALHRLSR